MKAEDKINNLRLELMQEIKTISEDVREIKDKVLVLPDELSKRFASKQVETDVKQLNTKFDDLNNWKIRIVAYVSVIMFIVTFFKDVIIGWFK